MTTRELQSDFPGPLTCPSLTRTAFAAILTVRFGKCAPNRFRVWGPM